MIVHDVSLLSRIKVSLRFPPVIQHRAAQRCPQVAAPVTLAKCRSPPLLAPVAIAVATIGPALATAALRLTASASFTLCNIRITVLRSPRPTHLA